MVQVIRQTHQKMTLLNKKIAEKIYDFLHFLQGQAILILD